jgi:hypothetical protein
VREIRTLRAMWRALETGLRQLLNGHEERNLGYKPRRSLRAAAPVLDPTTRRIVHIRSLPSVPAVAFGELARRVQSRPGPSASRICYPGRGSRTDTYGRPAAPPGTAAGSTPLSGERSRSGGEFVVFPKPWAFTITGPANGGFLRR